VLEYISHKAPHDLVFVHGAGGNCFLWRKTLEHLSGDSEALAVNLPGHPLGEITCRTIQDYSEALRRFILQLKGVRPVVCGHSMGGAVAMNLAIDHPEAIEGLVLVGTGAKLGVDPQILEGLRDRPMAAIEKTITPWSFYSIDLVIAREARAALSVSNLPVFLNDYLACQGFDVRGLVQQIKARTLIVCGDKDRMTPPKWSHYLSASISDSDLFFVKDSGHMLPIEKPESLAQLVQSFSSRLIL
jgi:pimeloyl-ACP methyl ester carboxylesterase